MIRRDTRLADGSRAWALISQIEHARISAELASHCVGRLAASVERQAVLAAILHHDDGWAEWERSPRLDPELARPLSFTELEAAEAVAIWDASVDAAAAFGPLAASMVAGHFLRLLDHSDSLGHEGVCTAWHEQMTARRRDWLAQWEAIDPAAHTTAVAADALEWLWTFDEISLWFCTTCPTVGETERAPAPPYRAGRGTAIAMQLQGARQPGRASATPWRFDLASIAVAAEGRVVPAKRYASSQELVDAARPCRLQWQFSGEV